MSSLRVTLPSPGSGSNKEQIDGAQWASSLGPKRIGMSSQAETHGAPSLWVGVEVDRSSLAVSYMGETCTYWIGGCLCRLLAPWKNYTTLYVFRSYNWTGCTSVVFVVLQNPEDRERNPGNVLIPVHPQIEGTYVSRQQINVLADACIVTYKHV